ncbi:hypothetical protein Sste5346_005210 [Sporothrix stenoceras]|uniref:F-box domain-containing protein n=1 Tax=Sporothrix stenoceras TaxID=5173 RepID=A0ABR3Z442_9PEZI
MASSPDDATLNVAQQGNPLARELVVALGGTRTNSFTALPSDILRIICDKLPENDILSLTQVSADFRIFFRDPRCIIPPPAADGNGIGNNPPQGDGNGDNDPPKTALDCVRNDPALACRFLTALAHDRGLCFVCPSDWNPSDWKLHAPDLRNVPHIGAPKHNFTCQRDCQERAHFQFPSTPIYCFTSQHVQMAIKLARYCEVVAPGVAWSRSMIRRNELGYGRPVSVDPKYAAYKNLMTAFTMAVNVHYSQLWVYCTVAPKIVLDRRDRQRDPVDGGRLNFLVRTTYPVYVEWNDQRTNPQSAPSGPKATGGPAVQNIIGDVVCLLGLPHSRFTHSIRLCPHSHLLYEKSNKEKKLRAMIYSIRSFDYGGIGPMDRGFLPNAELCAINSETGEIWRPKQEKNNFPKPPKDSSREDNGGEGSSDNAGEGSSTNSGNAGSVQAAGGAAGAAGAANGGEPNTNNAHANGSVDDNNAANGQGGNGQAGNAAGNANNGGNGGNGGNGQPLRYLDDRFYENFCHFDYFDGDDGNFINIISERVYPAGSANADSDEDARWDQVFRFSCPHCHTDIVGRTGDKILVYQSLGTAYTSQVDDEWTVMHHKSTEWAKEHTTWHTFNGQQIATTQPGVYHPPSSVFQMYENVRGNKADDIDRAAARVLRQSSGEGPVQNN